MKKHQIVKILEIIIFCEFLGRGISLLSDTFEKIMKLIFLS